MCVVLMRCAYQLWGLATHPMAPNLAVTTGDDRTIRLWDIQKHVLLKKVTVDAMSRYALLCPAASVSALRKSRRAWHGDVWRVVERLSGLLPLLLLPVVVSQRCGVLTGRVANRCRVRWSCGWRCASKGRCARHPTC